MTECSLGVLTILVDGDMENSGAGGRPFEHIEVVYLFIFFFFLHFQLIDK